MDLLKRQEQVREALAHYSKKLSRIREIISQARKTIQNAESQGFADDPDGQAWLTWASYELKEMEFDLEKYAACKNCAEEELRLINEQLARKGMSNVVALSL